MYPPQTDYTPKESYSLNSCLSKRSFLTCGHFGFKSVVTAKQEFILLYYEWTFSCKVDLVPWRLKSISSVGLYTPTILQELHVLSRKNLTLCCVSSGCILSEVLIKLRQVRHHREFVWFIRCCHVLCRHNWYYAKLLFRNFKCLKSESLRYVYLFKRKFRYTL